MLWPQYLYLLLVLHCHPSTLQGHKAGEWQFKPSLGDLATPCLKIKDKKRAGDVLRRLRQEDHERLASEIQQDLISRKRKKPKKNTHTFLGLALWMVGVCGLQDSVPTSFEFFWISQVEWVRSRDRHCVQSPLRSPMVGVLFLDDGRWSENAYGKNEVTGESQHYPNLCWVQCQVLA